MKFVLVALLLGESINISWPSAAKTVTKSALIEVKAGQTFDSFKENGNKWVRYDRGRKNLVDWKNVNGGKKVAVFLLYKGATLKNVILGANMFIVKKTDVLLKMFIGKMYVKML